MLRSGASEHREGPSRRFMVTKIGMRIPAAMQCRPVAIDMVSALAEHVATADRSFRNAVVTAFGEAFNNVVLHGYRGRADGMLEIEAEIGPEWITLNLTDGGTEIDFACATPPDLDAMPEGGMGIFMICSLMDEVTYRPGSLNVLSMTKRMQRRSTSHLLSVEEG